MFSQSVFAKTRPLICDDAHQLMMENSSLDDFSKGKADYIFVDKRLRQLYLLFDGVVIKKYRVALGREPIGPKEVSGDGKTPEGNYIINNKNKNSQYHRALQISYPTPAQTQFANNKYNKDPGHSIMIHGLPKPTSKKLWPLEWDIHPNVNWTQGCIAVFDEEIEEIFRMVEVNTPITICP